MKITVDTREQSGVLGIFRDTAERAGFEWERKKLDMGDYQYGPFAVERKTIFDLWHTIVRNRSRRFYRQANRSILSERPVWMISGDISELRDRAKIEYNPNSIYGAIASLFVRYGIDTFWLRDRRQLFNLMLKIFEKYEQGKSFVPLKDKVKQRREGMKISVLTSIVGISPRIAKNLLGEFGCIRNVFNASKEELEKIDGIGDKKARRIIKTVGG